MAALRASTMSLYEVSDIIAGQFLPSIRPPQALMSHTSGRITSGGGRISVLNRMLELGRPKYVRIM
jgi:hypothetical protein